MTHYALTKAGKKSIRTACLRLVRYDTNRWTTAARATDCEVCRRTPFYRERRAAKGIALNGRDGPLPAFHSPIDIGARERGPTISTPAFIEYLGPLPEEFQTRGNR